ncbi:DMT family transporter [Haloechinothrix salitolerans]|uniref:DMT family transporter n=1 Tax=Haloechinothrix salitolerans TaxID=926830 RepID=A0ABW2BRZ9_9PSEU
MLTAVHSRARGRGAAALLVAGVCWGTGGIAGALLATSGDLHPLSIAAYRLLLGGVFVSMFLLATSGMRVPRTAASVRRLLVVGVLLAVFQASYFAAVTLTSVSLATMITIGSVPVFVVVATTARTGRRPSVTTLGALCSAIVGLVLLMGAPTGAGEGSPLIGIGCALLAGAGFATVTIATRRPVAGLDPLRTAAVGCLLGGALLLPAALMVGVSIPLRPEPVAAALYLGLVPTALAYTAYFTGLRSAHAVVAGLAVLLEPLTAALLATVLLGDRLGVVGWCGAGLLVVALAVSQLRPEPVPIQRSEVAPAER